MATLISHSPAETEALGEQWGRTAQPGLVIGLSGELGAGKTQLVRGLARGLGIPSRVHSPTFTLVNIYTGGRLTLYHLDLYRLDSPQQISDAGLEEFLEPEGVTVIEWAERLLEEGGRPSEGTDAEGQRRNLSPGSSFAAIGRLLSVRIETLNETERLVSYEAPGA